MMPWWALLLWTAFVFVASFEVGTVMSTGKLWWPRRKVKAGYGGREGEG